MVRAAVKGSEFEQGVVRLLRIALFLVRFGLRSIRTTLKFTLRSTKTALRFCGYVLNRVLRLFGYEKAAVLAGTAKVEDEEVELDEESIVVRHAALDSRSFQSIGGVRWVSDISYTQHLQNSRHDYPTPKSIRICYSLKSEEPERTIDFPLYGDLQKHERMTLGAALATLHDELRLPVSPIKALHFAPDLGKFLDDRGAETAKVPGYHADSKGNVLAVSDVAFNEELCLQFFRKVLTQSKAAESITTRARTALWNQRDLIVQRLSRFPEFTGATASRRYGSFRNRHVIDQDSAIAGGIFLGWPAREALTVDSDNDYLKSIYTRFQSQVRKISQPLGLSMEEAILRLCIKFVRSVFPRNTASAVKEFRDRNRIVADEEMGLDVFARGDTGDADHQSLLAAYLLERLNKELPELLSGKISIDRNWFPGEGHCWVRYTYQGKEVYIVDSAKDVMCQLDDYTFERWSYERPEDIAKARRLRPIHQLKAA